MPRVDVVRRTPLPRTFRVARVQGQFDLPLRDVEEVRIQADLPFEELDWQIGAIVGASGTGKSTVAREVFGADRVWTPERLTWSDRPIVEDFPPDASVDQIVQALTAVGLSSPPTWLRPYAVLSTGEQFRAMVARLLLEPVDPLVIDEFTSVVDRTVARAVSVALSRTVRERFAAGRKLVVVSCHKDFLPWLAPDWVLDTDTGSFFRWEPRRRPPLCLRVYHGELDAWRAFHRYHYLTADISPLARVFLATVEFPDEGKERLCGFFSVLPAMGMPGWVRGHRTVVLPDFQGLGIGNRLIEEVAEWLWRHERKRFRATTAAPAIVQHRLRHPEKWRLVRAPSGRSPSGNRSRVIRTSAGRLTTSWEYVPEELRGRPGPS